MVQSFKPGTNEGIAHLPSLECNAHHWEGNPKKKNLKGHGMHLHTGDAHGFRIGPNSCTDMI